MAGVSQATSRTSAWLTRLAGVGDLEQVDHETGGTPRGFRFLFSAHPLPVRLVAGDDRGGGEGDGGDHAGDGCAGNSGQAPVAPLQFPAHEFKQLGFMTVG